MSTPGGFAVDPLRLEPTPAEHASAARVQWAELGGPHGSTGLDAKRPPSAAHLNQENLSYSGTHGATLALI